MPLLSRGRLCLFDFNANSLFQQTPHSWQVDVSYVIFALKEDNKEKSKSHESLLIFDSNIP